MQLKCANGPDSGSLTPSLALGGVPLPSEMLECVVRSFHFCGFSCSFRCEWVAALGCVVAQLRGFLPRLFSGQLMAAFAIGTQSNP